MAALGGDYEGIGRVLLDKGAQLYREGSTSARCSRQHRSIIRALQSLLENGTEMNCTWTTLHHNGSALERAGISDHGLKPLECCQRTEVHDRRRVRQ